WHPWPLLAEPVATYPSHVTKKQRSHHKGTRAIANHKPGIVYEISSAFDSKQMVVKSSKSTTLSIHEITTGIGVNEKRGIIVTKSPSSLASSQDRIIILPPIVWKQPLPEIANGVKNSRGNNRARPRKKRDCMQSHSL